MDFLFDREAIEKKTDKLVSNFVKGLVHRDDFSEIYSLMGVIKVSYRIEYDKDPMSNTVGPEFIMESEQSEDGSIVMYETEGEPGEHLDFDYSRDGATYVVSYWYIRKNIKISEEERVFFKTISDKLYMVQSIIGMREMLDFARNHNQQSGILNGVGLRAAYREAVKNNPDIRYTVLFINLRNFKYINERAGSVTGDEAIIQFSRRITTYLDTDEDVGHIGGDNFLMYLRPENVDKMLHRLDAFVLDDLKSAPGKRFVISAWIGLSADDHDEDINKRIEHASVANSFGKQRLNQQVVYYSEKFGKTLDENRKVASLFSPALAKKEFKAYFQAKVNMSNGEILGFETLCRWIHDGEFIFPDQFIPVIDRMGMLHELDMEILRLTCESIKNWKEMGLDPPTVSVNFSRKDIFVPDIENEIFKVVKSYGLETDDIEIEITETASEDEYDRIIDFTTKLKEMGFHIAIDDFGTGYSSLSLIHNIKADIIKIDKSFITNIHAGSRSEVLVESIITIAKKLNMDIVAEGVETPEEGRHLLRLGCKTAQGYIYSRPSNYEYTTDLLKHSPYKPIGEM